MGRHPPARKPLKANLDLALSGQDLYIFTVQNRADLFDMIGSFWDGLGPTYEHFCFGPPKNMSKANLEINALGCFKPWDLKKIGVDMVVFAMRNFSLWDGQGPEF